MVVDRELAPLGGSRARRRAVARLLGLLVCMGLGASYVGAFGHSGGWFAQPANAIVSIVQPGPEDAASNEYRSIEDYDLQYTAKQNPWLGLGFGKPFLTPRHLPDISRLDPYYLYIPHNTVYWVWMRLGAVGFFALWYLLGTIILRGCLAARRLPDPYLQLAAMFVVVITVMEVISASADYQLSTFRNVIYLGLLAGLVTKLPDLGEEHKRGSAHASPHGLPVPAASVVGRGYPERLSPPTSIR
jgi:O-antigen ligase